jgi:putative peptidoglycan lipid II flippase
MAAQYAQRDIKALRSTTNYGLRFIFFMTVPASALMIVLSLPIVQLLLQSGKYTAINARDAAAALQYYSIGIFAWSGQSILARAFYSVKNTKVPVIVGTVATLLFIPMNRPLMEALGFRGLALATTIASGLNMFTLLYLVRIRFRGIEGGKLLTSVTKTVIASLAAAAVCHELYRTIWATMNHNTDVFAHALLILIVCLGTGTAVYLGACSMMRMDEMKSLMRLLDRMRSKLARGRSAQSPS